MLKPIHCCGKFILKPIVRSRWPLSWSELYIELLDSLARRASAGEATHRQAAIGLQRHLHKGTEVHGHWETVVTECAAWKQTVQQGLPRYEESLGQLNGTKRSRKKARSQGGRRASDYICAQCGRGCHSRISLTSDTWCCNRALTTTQSAYP